MSSVTRTYFTLNVEDMPRAVHFYREVLGPVIRYESEQWSDLKLGDATVALHASPGQPRDTGLTVEVDELDAACSAVGLHGGRLLAGPEQRGPIRAADVADTEGNTFTIVAS